MAEDLSGIKVKFGIPMKCFMIRKQERNKE